LEFKATAEADVSSVKFLDIVSTFLLISLAAIVLFNSGDYRFPAMAEISSTLRGEGEYLYQNRFL